MQTNVMTYAGILRITAFCSENNGLAKWYASATLTKIRKGHSTASALNELLSIKLKTK